MKYIYKVTIFMVLGLLLVSCSKSNTKAKTNEEIIVRGVLEKGKATDASCTIKTLKGKLYSDSNKITQGGYIASVPAGAFDIQCTINKYIDDKTGKPVTPDKPIVLESISFAKEGKNKTVNVNVLTDLVAKEIDRNKITDETSFNVVRESAITKALSDIETRLNHNITIGDIDTLHLDKAADNPLTKVSLAIQEQFNQDLSITTVSGALQAALQATGANSIVNQHASDLSQNAIGKEVDKSVKPPKPIKPSSLDGAMIGGQYIDVSLKEIDITQEVAFSVPARDIGEVVASNSVYITSNKTGETKPIKLEGGKNASYSTNNVKDLFKPDGKTTFTICVVPTMKTSDSTANGKCLSAKIKKTFVATAASSTETKTPAGVTPGAGTGTGAGTEAGTPGTGTGGTPGAGTGTGGTPGAGTGGTPGAGTGGTPGAGTGGTPGAGTGSGTITTDQGTGTDGSGTGIGKVTNPCDDTCTIDSLQGATINKTPIPADGNPLTRIDTSQKVEISIPANLVHKKNMDSLAITNGKSSLLVILIQVSNSSPYTGNIGNLFDGNKITTFTVCTIAAQGATVEKCKAAPASAKQEFKAQRIQTNDSISLEGAKIDGQDVASSLTIDVSKEEVYFSVPASSVTLSDNKALYIEGHTEDDQGNLIALDNAFPITKSTDSKGNNIYKSIPLNYFSEKEKQEITVTVCILNDGDDMSENCRADTAEKQTFKVTIKGIDAALKAGIGLAKHCYSTCIATAEKAKTPIPFDLLKDITKSDGTTSTGVTINKQNVATTTNPIVVDMSKSADIGVDNLYTTSGRFNNRHTQIYIESDYAEDASNLMSTKIYGNSSIISMINPAAKSTTIFTICLIPDIRTNPPKANPADEKPKLHCSISGAQQTFTVTPKS